MAKRQRTRKVPSRYGNLASNASSSSEIDEAFGDNSTDDPNFDPTADKRRKIFECEDDISSATENFDEEFDRIQTSSRSNQASERASLNAIERVPADDDLDSSLDKMSLRQLLMILHKNSFETLARLAVVEESLLRGGSLITVKTEKAEEEAFQKFHDFTNSYSLPMTKIDQVRTFESQLKDKKFEELTVSNVN